MANLKKGVREGSLALAAALLTITGCGRGSDQTEKRGAVVVAPATPIKSVNVQVVASFAAPWAMVFLPDGNMLVTERPPVGPELLNPVESGRLHVVTQAGIVSDPLAGLPDNVGLLDVVLDPGYKQDHIIYISYMERDASAVRVGRDMADVRVDPAGLAVVRGTLSADSKGTPLIANANVIWRQTPKVVSYPGSGEPGGGGRMAFSPDGKYLFIAAGDRQEFEPVQDLDNTLGKIVRIFPDGKIPMDNPFRGKAGALPEIWTLGHRNPYGLAFNAAGQLWENEMGPQGGDEFNLIEPGNNYGWPRVSYGEDYGGGFIAKPAAGDGFAASAYWWMPVIAPAGMIFIPGLCSPIGMEMPSFRDCNRWGWFVSGFPGRLPAKHNVWIWPHAFDRLRRARPVRSGCLRMNLTGAS